MSEIAVVATFVAKPGHEEKLKALLQEIVEPSRKDKGALQYDLHRDIKEPRRFVFFERWESEAALAAHDKTPHIAPLGAKLKDILESGEINVVAKL
jgi:quinol monooxygenase YgiN